MESTYNCPISDIPKTLNGLVNRILSKNFIKYLSESSDNFYENDSFKNILELSKVDNNILNSINKYDESTIINIILSDNRFKESMRNIAINIAHDIVQECNNHVKNK